MGFYSGEGNWWVWQKQEKEHGVNVDSENVWVKYSISKGGRWINAGWGGADVCCVTVGTIGGGGRGRKSALQLTFTLLERGGKHWRRLFCLESVADVGFKGLRKKAWRDSAVPFPFHWCAGAQLKEAACTCFGSWITILSNSAVPFCRHWIWITRVLFFHFRNKKSDLCRSMFGLLLKVGLAFMLDIHNQSKVYTHILMHLFYTVTAFYIAGKYWSHHKYEQGILLRSRIMLNRTKYPFLFRVAILKN